MEPLGSNRCHRPGSSSRQRRGSSGPESVTATGDGTCLPGNLDQKGGHRLTDSARARGCRHGEGSMCDSLAGTPSNRNEDAWYAADCIDHA
eukprot:1301137-Rhodomonas_salina.1